MGFWKNALLIVGGAAAGYIASRRASNSTEQGSDLTLRTSSNLSTWTGEDGTVAKFFDSKYGAPLKGPALSVLRFAANVKAGMDEKEAELKQKFEDQPKDIRPGSLDTWDSDYKPRRLATSAGDSLQSREDEIRRRLERDAELGKDFFA